MTDHARRLWFKALIAALVSGFAGGIVNGFAAVGIDPQHFNLVEWHALAKLTFASSIISGVLGVAMYLQRSPLPPE